MQECVGEKVKEQKEDIRRVKGPVDIAGRQLAEEEVIGG
jgi:hypothetical protein